MYTIPYNFSGFFYLCLHLTRAQASLSFLPSPTALHAYSQVIRDLLSDREAQEACNNYIAERASKGLRSLGVAISHDGGNSWELAGLISLLDPPRSDSAATIKRAQEMGIQVSLSVLVICSCTSHDFVFCRG